MARPVSRSLASDRCPSRTAKVASTALIGRNEVDARRHRRWCTSVDAGKYVRRGAHGGAAGPDERERRQVKSGKAATVERHRRTLRGKIRKVGVTVIRHAGCARSRGCHDGRCSCGRAVRRFVEERAGKRRAGLVRSPHQDGRRRRTARRLLLQEHHGHLHCSRR